MAEEVRDILQLIRKASLSEKRKQVAKYILDNCTEAAFLTAAELARRSSVSEPTVIRLAAALGYSGFPAMRSTLQDRVQSKLNTVNRLTESHRLKSSKSPAIRSLLTDMKNLEETLHSLDIRTLNDVVGKLVNADKVIIIGYKMSSPLAQFLQMALKKTIDNTVAVTAGGGLFEEELVVTTPSSVVVAISFPRYTNMVVQHLCMAGKRNLITIAITDSELSPLVEFAKYRLLARCKLVSYIDSFAAAMSLLCAVSTAVSIKGEDVARPRLEELEALWEESGVFF